MVNVTIYPYGNAHEKQAIVSQEWEFTCQHGSEECDANMVETCFINLVGFDQNKYMEFLFEYEKALEAQKRKDAFKAAKSVYDAGNWDPSWDDLSDCMGTAGENGGKTGNQYMHQMALWTAAAKHQYTPWITLNGQHTTTIQDDCVKDTLACTCAVYGGTNPCCKKYQTAREDVCWKDQ